MERRLQKRTIRIAKRARELRAQGLSGVAIAEKLNAEGFTTSKGTPIKAVNVLATYLKGRMKRTFKRKQHREETTLPTRAAIGGDELELITLVLASKLDPNRKLTAISAITEGRV